MKTTLHRRRVGLISTSTAVGLLLAIFLVLGHGSHANAQTVTFNYTGGLQTYTVPLASTSIIVDVYGAAGYGALGYGGRVQATYPVTGGEVLNIYVGGAGTETTGGYNGGGDAGSNTGYGSGGGASDIRRGGSALSNRVIVAGGGGGTGSNCGTNTAEGGDGGGLVGGSGCLYSCSDCQYTGGGGTQIGGGTAGPTSHSSCGGNQNGSLGQGGSNTLNGFGTGGGGGYYGGGSGCFEGAGGGSSYTGPSATSITHTAGVRMGNGMIVITPNNTPPCPSPSNVTANPAMVCPGTVSNMNATSTGNTISWYTVPSGGVTIGTSASGANFPVTPLGTTTYYAEASGGSCSASPRIAVTITLDNVAPVAVCQTVTVNLDTTGNGSTTAAAIGSGSTDNCTISNLSLSQSSFNCSNAGNNSVTLTVTDNNGNTSSCIAVVSVVGAPIASTATAFTTSCGYNVSCPGASDGVATATGSNGCPSYTFLWSNGQTSSTATGLSAGTHTVTVTDASGTTHVTSVTLSEPSPIQVASSLTMACVGAADGAIDITATGGNDCNGYNYSWSNGDTSQDLSNVVPGLYTVTVIDANGCTGVQSITLTALPAPLPTFTQSGNQLTASQTWATYQWLMNGSAIPGATAMTYILTQTANYSLQVTDSNGCLGTSGNTSIVGVSDHMGDWAELSIFPNPTRGEFKLRTAAPISYAISVSIDDMFGRKMMVQSLTDLGREVAFDIKGFAPGTYMVEVTSEAGQRKVFRLVVQ